MIVVATDDFSLYHGVVDELRARDATFTTVEPAEDLPDSATVVITDDENERRFDDELEVVVGDPNDPRSAVDRALTTGRSAGGRTVVGVDPGKKPGIAVLVDGTVVAAFRVPLTEAVAVIEAEIAEAVDPVIRIGDGARLRGAELVNELDDVRVELVDETATTPYLGTGARGMGDVLAAVNIARREGEPIDRRDVEPTDGELQVIKNRAREASETNRTLDDDFARRVATGELTIEEALAAHRDRT